MEPSPATQERREKRKMLFPVLLFTEVLGILAVVLVIVWGGSSYLGGYAWDGSGKQFNWHPVFMILGMVYFLGNSMIIYRVFSTANKLAVKIVHTVLHGGSMVFIILALIAVFEFHNHNNIPNLYSLHSWVGIATVVMFFLQFLIGFLAYLLPFLPQEYRALMMPAHRFMGSLIFILVIVAVISGINEKLFFVGNGKDRPAYSTLPDFAVVGNMIGVSVILYAVGIGFIIANPNFERDNSPQPEYLNLQN